jgi:hypothetical protein
MTDVPFAAVSGGALSAYSRCSTMSAGGNLKTPRQSRISFPTSILPRGDEMV